MLHCVNQHIGTSVSEEGSASKISVSVYQLTWQNIPEDPIFSISTITFKWLETLIAICKAQGLLDIILCHQILKNSSVLIDTAAYSSEKLLIYIILQ